uniref:WH2 domain-containing protein n=1 Tax=Schistosoma curassoni TaxID=6186 RepID=A0A183KGD7_9TREM
LCVKAVRNGSSVPAPAAAPPPPTPARPSISKSNSNSSSHNNNNNSYPRYSFYKKPSEDNQPTPPVVPSSPVQVIMLSSIPASSTSSASPSSQPTRVTPLQLGSAANVHENNINVSNSNNTVNNLNGTTTTTIPPPPSGRSPRRKQSSSNRYQRAGSTNSDVNGIPVGQSTKVIRISSNINGSLTDLPCAPSSNINPYLPSSVYDMNNYTMNSRAHPTPPPPPPPLHQPSLSSMDNYNYDNNITSLVRHFESRFTFPDIGSVPVPKSYHGPKTYRVGSINSSMNNSNNINDNYRNQVPYRVAPAAPRNY